MLLEGAGAFRCLWAFTLAVGLELPRFWKLLLVDRLLCEFGWAGYENNQQQVMPNGMSHGLT